MSWVGLALAVLFIIVGVWFGSWRIERPFRRAKRLPRRTLESMTDETAQVVVEVVRWLEPLETPIRSLECCAWDVRITEDAYDLPMVVYEARATVPFLARDSSGEWVIRLVDDWSLHSSLGRAWDVVAPAEVEAVNALLALKGTKVGKMKITAVELSLRTGTTVEIAGDFSKVGTELHLRNGRIWAAGGGARANRDDEA